MHTYYLALPLSSADCILKLKPLDLQDSVMNKRATITEISQRDSEGA